MIYEGMIVLLISLFSLTKEINHQEVQLLIFFNYIHNAKAIIVQSLV